MIDLTDEEMNLVKNAINKFNAALKLVEPDSKDILALIIFINGCFDRKSYIDTRFQALVHYPSARKAGWSLDQLLQSGNRLDVFNYAIEQARNILIESNKCNPDLLLGVYNR
jgi:hypothetical protein